MITNINEFRKYINEDRHHTATSNVFDPKNPEYLDAWLNVGDEDEESYKEYGLTQTIPRIIDEVKNFKYPLRVYRGINWHGKTKPNILVAPSQYDSNISWTTELSVAESFGNVIFTGIIKSVDDIDIEYTIKRRIMHKPLDENEVIMKNYDNSLIQDITILEGVNEDRRQHIIPFEEPEFQKLSIHAHLQDAFYDLSMMRPDMYYSHGNPEDKMTKLRDKVFNFVVMEGDGDDTSVLTEYVWQFARTYDPIDDSEMYTKKFIKYALSEEEDALEDIYKFAEIAAKESNIKTVFSNAGWVQFKRLAGNIMDSDMENMQYAVESSYKENENGLIECWRVVDYVPGPNDDYYINIMAHGGVGVYWSWDEDAAHAHHGTSGAHSIRLHGFISVENVDWYETMWKNVTHLKDEKEIRTINNGNIMIVGYHDNENDQYVKLERPVVVKTGA
jgi:hypothetical protein